MDFHLERELRLHSEPEHKNLYKWAINEIDPQDQKAGSDQIPWEWSLDFTATSCVLSESLEISQPLKFKFNVTNQDGTVTERESGGKETHERRRVIHVRLRPGDARREEDDWHRTTYSMFGTKRLIKSSNWTSIN